MNYLSPLDVDARDDNWITQRERVKQESGRTIVDRVKSRIEFYADDPDDDALLFVY